MNNLDSQVRRVSVVGDEVRRASDNLRNSKTGDKNDAKTTIRVFSLYVHVHALDLRKWTLCPRHYMRVNVYLEI